MTFKRLVLFLCWVPVFTWVGAKAAGESGVHLIRQGGSDHINPLDEQLSRMMKWSHGAYLVMDQIGAEPPAFYTVDRDGTWTDTARFRNPESTRLYSFGCDRKSDGTIVFSGQTETAPRVESPFLAWTSADGQVQRMVRTDHYFPYKIAVAPDDTVWTLGYEMVNLDAEDPAVNQEAHVLRHFDDAGNLIESALPQSKFNRYERFRLTNSLLVASRERVGWYGPQYGKASYTEIFTETMKMKKYPATSTLSARKECAVGLAMANNGATSVSVQDGSPGGRTNYVLDRGSSLWVPVSVPPLGGFKFTPILIGSDGDNLVFKYGREAGFFSLFR